MEIPDSKYGYDDKISASKVRYKVDDPEINYEGVIIGLRFVTCEDGVESYRWEYQVKFEQPIYDVSWYEESALISGIRYEWM